MQTTSLPSPRRRALIGGLATLPLSARARQPLAVVASFSILADMVRTVAGGLAGVTSLVPPNTDAHVYQPTSADSRALAHADMLVENGLGFEGWMTRLGVAAGFHGTRVVASVHVKPRRMGPSAGGIDPHAWQDPRDGAIYARAIAEGLAAADPGNAAAYQTNAAVYVAAIGTLDAWIAGQFAAIQAGARRIVTTHDAFGYYGDRYGIEFLAAEGIATDSEPSAKSVGALVAQIRREKVRTVFLENMADPRLARMLARETGATVSGPLFADALSAPDGPAPDYLSMLRYNTELFAHAMGPA